MVTTAVRRSVLDRDDWRCQECGTHRDVTVDHIVPRIKGGTDDPDNLRTLCRPCNSRKCAEDKRGAAGHGSSTRRQVAIRLNRAGVAELDRIASAEGRTRSEVFRMLLREALAARGGLEQAASSYRSHASSLGEGDPAAALGAFTSVTVGAPEAGEVAGP